MMKLFVYGTLLTGYGNWSWALSPRKGVPDEIRGAELYHLGGFPGMKHSDNPESIVKGELFEIDEIDLARIDRLEGYNPNREVNDFYTREVVTTEGGVEAYTYFYQGNPTPDRLIPSGDFRVAERR